MKKQNKPRKAQKPNPQLALHMQAMQLAEIIAEIGKEDFLQCIDAVFEIALFNTPAEMFNEHSQYSLYVLNLFRKTVRRM